MAARATVVTDELDDLDGLFGASGPLSRALHDFAPRAEQLAMARDVAAAIRSGQHLIVEAGTGTGKTLAYLVPVLLAGRRAIVSTGTRTLQDQLYHRDLPQLGAALGRPVTVRLLKGRSNYLCRYRLDHADGELPLSGTGMADALDRIRAWAQQTREGDVAELAGIPDEAPVWRQVTSTADNCLGARCPQLQDCHVVRARHAARDADVVVVNHHLLLADLTMKEEGFGELLPGGEVVVVDEAHHFPDVAQGFFNISVSRAQLLDLAADAESELHAAGLGDARWRGLLGELRAAASAPAGPLRDAGEENVAWDALGPDFHAALETLDHALDGVCDDLGAVADAGSGLRRCRERAVDCLRRLREIAEADDGASLRWLRASRSGFTVNLTPLDTSAELRALLEAQACTWVFTSATLAVGDDFGHFTARLGLERALTRQIQSPFDFARIARLYLPDGMPDPAAPGYTDAVIDAVLPVLARSRGRAFVLFTSHRALRHAAERLARDADFPFPLLVQGQAPRSRLLEQFAALPDPVLLGTATFWEGVDIRGPGLVVVAIDRLPFASPGDPLLAARLEAVRAAGGNPFRDCQLPQAVLALKQGVGRLIRDYGDYGIVMICDPRLTRKAYGRPFLASLPPMPVVRDLEQIDRFFREREAA